MAFFTNIIHRFGVPNSIITNNGTQFTSRKFLDFCEDHHIRVDWVAMAHPMTNGQVERANGMILQGLKPRIYNDLNKFGKRWMKELPSVVWSLRTTPSRAIGIPNSIITDNGTQFTGKKFLDFCEDHHIRVDWAVVAHPMTNGQVERANGMILQGLKPRIYNNLNKFGKRWIKELPSVVWSLRTTPSQATGFSPFFLVYGAEAISQTLSSLTTARSSLGKSS